MLAAILFSLLLPCCPLCHRSSLWSRIPTHSSWHSLLEFSRLILLGSFGLGAQLRNMSSVYIRRDFVSLPRSTLHCLYNQNCPPGFVPPALSSIWISNKSCSVLCDGEYLQRDSSSLRSVCGLEVMKERDLENQKLVVAAGLPLPFPISLLYTSLQRWPGGQKRVPCPLASSLVSPQNSHSSSKTGTCQALSRCVLREELLGSRLLRSSFRKYVPLLTWPGSVKIRTRKLWLRPLLFWTGPWSVSCLLEFHVALHIMFCSGRNSAARRRDKTVLSLPCSSRWSSLARSPAAHIDLKIPLMVCVYF